jgi:hypothetical protein
VAIISGVGERPDDDILLDEVHGPVFGYAGPSVDPALPP